MTAHRNVYVRSGDIAKARASLTVASDRLDCCQDELQQMKDEVAEVLEKYLDLNRTAYGIRLEIVFRKGRGVQDVKTIQIK
jgi:septum formation topological specificity factor MinE